MTEISLGEDLTTLQEVVDSLGVQMNEIWPLMTLITEDNSRQRLKGLLTRVADMMSILERIEFRLARIKQRMEPEVLIPDHEYQHMLRLLEQLDALRGECKELTDYYNYLETAGDLNGASVFH